MLEMVIMCMTLTLKQSDLAFVVGEKGIPVPAGKKKLERGA